jgi:sorbitol-specific phosphotransferase system component IIC
MKNTCFLNAIEKFVRNLCPWLIELLVQSQELLELLEKKKKKKKKKKTQRSLVARFEFFSLNKHTHIYTPKN